MSPQKSRAIQPLETPRVRPATEPAGGSAGQQGLALQLAKVLKREGDRESTLGFYERTYWLPIAERLLEDETLIDALLAYAITNGQAGIAVGYIVRRAGDLAEDPPTDEDGERMFDVYRYDHQTTIADARLELRDAKQEMPEDDWRIYALTDITEEPGNAD